MNQLIKQAIQRFLIIGFLVLSVKARAQSGHIPDTLKSFLDTVVNLTHSEALNRDSVNWNDLQSQVYQKAENAKSVQDVIPAIQYIFDQLHDNHGGIVYKGRFYGSHKPRQVTDKALWAQIRRVGMPPKLKVLLLDGDYGYIRMPSIEIINQSDNSKFAQEIKDSICRFVPKKVKGWIIDLRLDPGGSMYPMIGGLGSIIGDGVAGFFIDNSHHQQHTWSIKGGDVYYDTLRLTTTTNSCIYSYKKTKIAVLTGPITQSAAEATAISFKGKKDVKFFGENTGGFTTANLTHQLKYNTTLLIANSVESDRNKKLYMGPIAPNVSIVSGDDFINLANDTKVSAALKWLKE